MVSQEISLLFQGLGFLEASSITTRLFCQGAAALLGVDAALLDPFELDLSLKEIFPPSLAASCKAVPLQQDDHHLYVALLDPFDGASLSLLQLALDKTVKQIVAPLERVEELLNDYCHGGTVAEKISTTPVADDVATLLEYAIMVQASDLHLDPTEDDWHVRCRIAGTLQDHSSFSKSRGLAILSRIKLMAHLDITEQRRAQDGRLEYRPRQGANGNLNSSPVAFRIATLPTHFGESLVLRLLDRCATCLDLEVFPFSPAVRASLLKLLQEPYGLFMITGPTGSGKTTTLYSCLQYFHEETLKIVTVEDPVEYELDGVLQIPIHEAIGLSFARTLRSLLRHDPDIIMVGEMRDAATAHMALQASLTGHRVWTTLHTNDAASAIVRLLEMGGEATTLATSLRGVLAQRLLKTICPLCRTAYGPDENILSSLGLSNVGEDLCFYRGVGCADCEQTGYAGRLPIFELFLVTREIQKLIHQGASHLLLREKAIEQGMVTLRTEALRLLDEGMTTVEEVLQWT